MLLLCPRPQSGIMTGQILLQQFYCHRSVKSFALLVSISFPHHLTLLVHIQEVAMACTLIAGKVEECCRRVRDVVNIYHWLYQTLRRTSRTTVPRLMDYVGEDYYRWRDRVTATESEVLFALGFHVQPRHPVGLLANYLNALELSEDPRVAQRAINLVNDGLRGVAFVCQQPATIACAAVEWAATQLNINLLSDDTPWWSVFDVQWTDLQMCQRLLLDVYNIADLDIKIPLSIDEFDSLQTTARRKEDIEKENEDDEKEEDKREKKRSRDRDRDHDRERDRDRDRDERHKSFAHSRQVRSRSRSRRSRSYSRSPSSRRQHSRSRSRSRSRNSHHHHRERSHLHRDRDYRRH